MLSGIPEKRKTETFRNPIQMRFAIEFVSSEIWVTEELGNFRGTAAEIELYAIMASSVGISVEIVLACWCIVTVFLLQGRCPVVFDGREIEVSQSYSFTTPLQLLDRSDDGWVHHKSLQSLACCRSSNREVEIDPAFDEYSLIETVASPPFYRNVNP